LLSEWAASGLPPEEFWIQTPRTYLAIMDGILRRIRSQKNNLIEQAWRAKLPPLENFLLDVESGRPLDKSTLNETHVSADDGLDAWFVMLESLNGAN